MPFSPEMTAKIAEWRRRAVAGELTLDEMKEAIQVLRQDRVGAHVASTTSRTAKAAAKAPVDVNKLLGDLGIGG